MTQIDYAEFHRRLEPLDGELEEYLDGNWVRHPWIFDIVDDRSRAAWINHWFRIKRAQWEEALAERDWLKFVCVYERPHRLEGFFYIADECTHDDYWNTLGFVWSDSENIWQNIDAWQELWNCDRPNKLASMNEQERAALAALPSDLTIYRGFTEGRLHGMSWTLDRDVAVRFAKRFRGPRAAIATARAKKSDVHAFFDDRQEREIVVEKYTLLDEIEVPEGSEAGGEA
ncbi:MULTISPECIES: hypothetical protein [unclassified Bradyrhizobium]|uniref:hypothetical protein n=1 Tax=unclassified Bradyrhizobium TaxID=2631580 RepID=UPI001FF890CA|nr:MULTISPECIES: hypothetical protein [unclassified Bradyrhizobium]MCK1344464.1 hypothetical protein [Bradyrhizobium sp. CW11]MCK1591044.1 hypothetical protein [Bradyrhizobium sp. 169]